MSTISKIANANSLYKAVEDDYVSAVIGGRNVAYFAPSVNLSLKCRAKNGVEQGFINLVDDPSQINTQQAIEELSEDGTLSIREGDQASTFRLVNGALKLERVFYSRPTQDVRYKITASPGVSFHLQEELTAEEITLGAYRPDDIVNSFAVLHDRKGRFVDKNGAVIVDYGYGKVCHIKAAYWVDAVGNTVKAYQNIVGNFLTVELPSSDWLDSVVYPLRLDPELTIGGTVAGGSNIGLYSNRMQFFFVGAPAYDGVITSLSVFMNYFDYNTPDVAIMGVYKAGSPFGDKVCGSSLLTATDPSSGTKTQYDFTVAGSPTITADEDLYVSLATSKTGDYDGNSLISYAWYDTVADHPYYYATRAFDETVPDPAPSASYVSGTRLFGAFITYEYDEGGTVARDVAGTLPAFSGSVTRKTTLKRSVGGAI